MTKYNNCSEVTDLERDFTMRKLYDQGLEEKDLYLIRASRLFSGTTVDELITMMCCLSPELRMFGKGEFIFRHGERIENTALILEGTASIEKEDSWANKRNIDTIGASDTFGTSYACSPSALADLSVVATTDVKLMFFNCHKILTMCPLTCDHHARIIRNLIGELAERNLYLTRKLSHVIQKTTRAKLLGYLSDYSQSCGALSFNIPLSRQELADYLGVDRSGISVEISKLCDEGVIEANKNHFTLKF